MNTTTDIILAAVAAWVGFSSYAVFTRQSWVVDNLDAYGVPRSWWPWLGTAKALGATGLAVGVWLPAVGLLASLGLVAYFLGAALTVLHARAYGHIVYPMLFLSPVCAVAFMIVNR